MINYSYTRLTDRNVCGLVKILSSFEMSPSPAPHPLMDLDKSDRDSGIPRPPWCFPRGRLGAVGGEEDGVAGDLSTPVRVGSL